MDQEYLKTLLQQPGWLPGIDKLFNAFSLPLDDTQYILFGESPYPRAESANGYAFWDASVGNIWSKTGLTKMVNKATSLRNIIKMLLVAERQLTPDDTSQTAISKIDKSNYIKTLTELFNNLNEKGILLLNATLVLRTGKVSYDSRYWLAFIESLLSELSNRDIILILLGKIAKIIDRLAIAKHYQKIYAEHPYNLSFINNPNMLTFFKRFTLLHKTALKK